MQAALLGLVALIIAPGYWFYFDVTPKVVVLLAGVAVLLVCTTPLAPLCYQMRWTLWRRHSGRGALGARRDSSRPLARSSRKSAPMSRGCPLGPADTSVCATSGLRRFTALLLLSAASLAFSTALSAHPGLSLFGTNWRRFGSLIQAAILLLAWLIANHTAGRPERSRVVLRGIAVAGGIAALYGIAQYFGWDPFLPAAGYHIGEGLWTIVRPPGAMGHADYFAAWLLAATFLSVALAELEEHSAGRRMARAVALVMAVAMLLTGTRSALAGLLAGLLTWGFRSGFRVNRRVLAAAALLLAGGAAFLFSPAGWSLRARTRWFVEDPWGGGRLALWRDSLRMALGRLPAGYGPETFTAAFPRYESAALAESYPDFAWESPHNIFLDALVSQGLPGLVALAGLCAVAFWRPLPNGAPLGPGSVNGRARDWVTAALAAGIVSQQFMVFTVPTAALFYAMLALSVGLDSGAPPQQPARLSWRVASVLAAAGLAFVAVRCAVADHALARTQQAVESADLSRAIPAFEQYQRWSLPGGSADLWFSRALVGVAQKAPDARVRLAAIRLAVACGERATGTSEDPFNAWYSLAALRASQNDAAGSEASLRAAIAAHPNWFKPHWTLAQLLRLEGRMEEAERQAARAAQLDAGKDPEVGATLVQIRAAQAGPRGQRREPQ